MGSSDSVSIIFSNYNGGNEPIDCLRSIEKLDYPEKLIETIIIDNASQDGSKERILKLFPKTKLIALKKDIGLPASLNLGIKSSEGSYIMIANDDIVFGKNSITAMVNYLKKEKNIGILGGKVFFKDHPKKISQSACDFNFYLGEIKKGMASGKKIKWLQSCAIMVPKNVFEKIGLFDDAFYPLYFDDFDFCLRAKKAGVGIARIPDAVFWHGAGKTTQKFGSKKVYFWWYRNKIRFYLKHATILQFFTAAFIQIMAVAAKSIKERQNLLAPFIMAVSENLKTKDKTLKLRYGK